MRFSARETGSEAVVADEEEEGEELEPEAEEDVDTECWDFRFDASGLPSCAPGCPPALPVREEVSTAATEVGLAREEDVDDNRDSDAEVGGRGPEARRPQ